MKGKKLLIMVGSMCLVLILAACAAPAPAPPPAPAPAPAPAPVEKKEPIVLKALSSNPLDHWLSHGFALWMNTVNERAQGELKIEWAGAKEVVPMTDQSQAVISGVYDLCMTWSGTHQGEVPETQTVHLTQITPWEEEVRGYIDYMNEFYHEGGLHYLGRALINPDSFMIYLNKKVSKPEDLKDLTIGTGPIFIKIFKDYLGIEGINIKTAEKYEAMERGLVDGNAASIHTHLGLKEYEVTKYYIDHGVFASDYVTIVNLDTWNRIPEHLQYLMRETKWATDVEADRFVQNKLAEMKIVAQEAGETPIHFSPEDAEWYTNVMYKGSWEQVSEAIGNPEVTAKLRELLSR